MAVLPDGGGVFDLQSGGESADFALYGFDRAAFADDPVRRQVFPLSPRRFAALRFCLTDGGFCAPFGVYFITYGYTVAGRIRQ